MNILLTVAAICVATAPSPSLAAEYVAGVENPPASLADGIYCGLIVR